MRVLIADDDRLHRRLLETIVRQWGHDVEIATDGRQALNRLSDPSGPSLALLDWMMPEMNGDEVCRTLRAHPEGRPLYLIMVTARTSKEDILGSLHSGADDFIPKPFDREELFARLQVGLRVVGLQDRLQDQIRSLTDALNRVKLLQGLLPICCYCHNVRSDDNYWQKVERYVADHSELRFSHAICPQCYQGVVQPQLRAAGIVATEDYPQ